MKQIITLFFLLTFTTVFSQSLIITDAETGKSIDGVAVFNKNKTTAAVSGVDGVVNISDFKKNEIIIFSHVGYAELQEKKISIKRK